MYNIYTIYCCIVLFSVLQFNCKYIMVSNYHNIKRDTSISAVGVLSPFANLCRKTPI